MNKYYTQLTFYEKKGKRDPKNNPLLNKNIYNLKKSDLDYMLNTQITIEDLKRISNKHGIKIKGKKNDKIYNFYNILLLKINVLKILNSWKNFINYKIMNLQGPAKFKRKICNNEEDFLTMENMKEIDPYYFYSFRDEDKFVYGFNLKSIKQMIDKKQLFNPYNRKKLSRQIIDQITERIKYNNLGGYNIDKKVKEEKDNIIINTNNQIRHKIMSLFQYIDTLGYYTNIEWFLNLSRELNIKFIKELYDIWNYRAGLNEEKKIEICPHCDGNPFRNINLTLLNIRTIPDITIKNMSIMIITNFLSPNTENDNGNKNISAMYILSALTLVSNDAADCLPWLYLSVAN